MEPENKAPATPQPLPDWAIHISKVYAWAEQPRPFGGKITKRTIQWYSSSGMIPPASRIGKEAYYNKNEIFHYLRVIEILNRKFNLLLSQVRTIIRNLQSLADEDGLIHLGFDENDDEGIIHPVEAISDLLQEYLEYEGNEAAQCEATMDGPNWTVEQHTRLQTLQNEIVKRLLGDKKALEHLLLSGLLQVEAELFPKGKVLPEDAPF